MLFWWKAVEAGLPVEVCERDVTQGAASVTATHCCCFCLNVYFTKESGEAGGLLFSELKFISLIF